MANLKPGRQLDALVAERVMGLHVTNQTAIEGGFNPWIDESTKPCPNYSTNIADAWAVVEKIRKLDGENGQRWHWHIQEIPCMNWMASVNDEKAFVLREGKERYEAEGDTAQHAICLLALDVMEAMAA